MTLDPIRVPMLGCFVRPPLRTVQRIQLSRPASHGYNDGNFRCL